MKKTIKFSLIFCVILAGMVVPGIIVIAAALEWRTGADGKQYWYEDGIKQGCYGDPKNIIDDIYGNERGREIYDPGTNGWYWLDAVYDGAKAVDKEVWMPYIYQQERIWTAEQIEQNAAASGTMSTQVKNDILNHRGKWVRYDKDGKMYKGWYSVTGRDAEIYPNQAGNIYYYDPKTGLMAKGWTEIDGRLAHFNEVTGVFTHYLDTNSKDINDYLTTVKITPENFSEYFEFVSSVYEEINSFGEGTGEYNTTFGVASKKYNDGLLIYKMDDIMIEYQSGFSDDDSYLSRDEDSLSNMLGYHTFICSSSSGEPIYTKVKLTGRITEGYVTFLRKEYASELLTQDDSWKYYVLKNGERLYRLSDRGVKANIKQAFLY